MLIHFIEDNQYFIRVQTFTNDYSRKETNKNRVRLFHKHIFVLSTNGAGLIEITKFKTAAAPIP
jgi:hypothetical protein